MGTQALDSEQCFLNGTGYDCAIFLRKHVVFRAEAEVGQIDSGFDRENCIGEDAAFVVRFEIIHVRARAMDIGRDGMPRSMDKALAKTSLANRFTRSIIDFETMQRQ